MNILNKHYCWMFGHGEPVQYSSFSLIKENKLNVEYKGSSPAYCSECGSELKEERGKDGKI